MRLTVGASSQLDDLESCYGAGVEGEAYKCPDLLPSVIAGGSGIDVEQVEPVVGHYFEYVAVPADKELDAVAPQIALDAGRVASGIAAYMGEPYAYTFGLEA